MARRRFRDAAIFGLLACALAAPWYARSAAVTGNPLWPGCTSLFGPNTLWNADDADMQAQDLHRHYVKPTPDNLLSIPWRLSTQPGRGFNEMGVSLLLWVGILYSFLGPNRKTSGRLLLLTGPFILVWYFAAPLTRYFAPVLGVLAVVAALGYDHLTRSIQSGYVRNALVGGLMAVCLISPYDLLYFRAIREQRGMPPLTWQERERYLADRMAIYRPLRMAVGAGGRIYGVFSENMTYYADGKMIGDWVGPARYSEFTGALSSDENLRRYLDRFGIDTVFVNYEAMHPDYLDKMKQYKSLCLVYEDRSAAVYRVVSAPATAPVMTGRHPMESGRGK